MSLMDLSGAVLSLSSGTYTVTRYAAASFSSTGRVSAGTSSTFSITASVQPVSGREIDRLPEGLRAREVLALYTDTALQTRNSTAGAPDVVSIDGSAWEVQTVENWNSLGTFYKALLTRVGY